MNVVSVQRTYNAAVVFLYYIYRESQIQVVPCSRITGNLQAVSSDTGNLLDDFTLVKPANYTPNYAGRAHLAVSFTSHYVLPSEYTWKLARHCASASVLIPSGLGVSSSSGNLVQPQLTHLLMLLHCLEDR